jgi:perosamine synthetase
MVPDVPILELTAMLARPRTSLPAPLNGPHVTFFPYGRIALLQGLKLMRIQAGDNLLIPTLICSSVVAPLNKLGVKVRYYDVDENLQPRLDTAKTNSRTRAFLGVNYFGFGQDAELIADFCARHGLYYVEDNAHGFLSSTSRPLGTFGDIAIFSQRKTVPLPNGGALLINERDLADIHGANADGLELRSKTSVSRFVLRQLALNFGFYAGLDIASLIRKFPPSRIGDEENDLRGNLEPYSYLANWVLCRIDIEREKERRRKQFMACLEYSRDWSPRYVRPVFRELPAGVVPYAFPFRVSGRTEFIDHLRRIGIWCFPWPALPSTAPRTRLSEELILIPMHSYPRRDPLTRGPKKDELYSPPQDVAR